MSNYRSNNLGGQVIGQNSANDGVQSSPKMGMVVTGHSPYWGGGEFMYVQFGSAVREKALVAITNVFEDGIWKTKASEMPNVGNTGRVVGVAVMPAASNDFGWVQISGTTVVNSNAAIAADTPIGIGAAGQAGAVSNGKQILGARVQAAATATVVQAALGGKQGLTTIEVANTEGLFVGAYLSGTGIAAGARITAIGNDNKTVSVSSANTAPVSGNVTCTYNNGTVYFPIVYLNRAHVQSQTT